MDQYFHSIKITPALSIQYAAALSKFHRHNYEEIIIVATGRPQHFIDFNKAPIDPPKVIYVAQVRIRRFLPDKKQRICSGTIKLI